MDSSAIHWIHWRYYWAPDNIHHPQNRRLQSRLARFRFRCRSPVHRPRRSLRWRHYRTQRCCSHCSDLVDRRSYSGDRSRRCLSPTLPRYEIPTRRAASTNLPLYPEMNKRNENNYLIISLHMHLLICIQYMFINDSTILRDKTSLYIKPFKRIWNFTIAESYLF